MTEMNVTNLLDTAFVLLMAFMIVAPSIKYGIELELPQVKEAPTVEVERSMTVILKLEDGVPWLYLDGNRVSNDELKERLSKRLQIVPDLDVILQMDHRVTAQDIMTTIATIQSTGVDTVAFEVEPDRRGR
jgi:biopolymer transport protein ExbD